MMQTTRRGLITGLGAMLAMPAIARAESLMRISSRFSEPFLWGDGIHDDTAELQRMIAQGGRIVFGPHVYRVTSPLFIGKDSTQLLGLRTFTDHNLPVLVSSASDIHIEGLRSYGIHLPRGLRG